MNDNEKDIDDLMCWLSSPPAHDWDEKPSEQDRYYRAITALVAERNELTARVRNLKAVNSTYEKIVAERNALRDRVAELEAKPPASDLREQMSAMMSWMTHVTDMIVIHGLHADHAKIELSRRIDRAIVAANKHGGDA